MARFKVALEFAGMGEINYIVTDGRFSVYTEETAIGSLAPEAAVGGTIALVRDGDIIEIDIEKRSSSRVVQSWRREQWRRSAEP